jgi:mannose-1-phosphate guanylyltransferase
MKIVPIILAGGKGERFWPLSRTAKPKQLLKLISDKSLICDTINNLQEFSDIHIITNEYLKGKIIEDLDCKVDYIVEPMPRNTGPAVGFAAAYIHRKFGDSILLFDTSDHYYADRKHYIKDLKIACSQAETTGKIILIGIKPTFPHTGYGYIENGEKVDENLYLVKRFTEKPSLKIAEEYLKNSDYNWNSGILISKSSVILSEIKEHIPDLHNALETITESDFDKEILKTEFEKVKGISFDYGVLEKSENKLVLNSSMHWDDVGDFEVLAKTNPADQHKNHYKTTTETYLLDAHNNIIVSNKMVAMIGIENSIVIDVDDCLYICNRNQTQKIKELLKKINKKYL